MTREEIQNEIKELGTTMNELELKRDALQESMYSFELDPYDYEDEYYDMLLECYPKVNICGMIMEAAYILREMDPIAYRCGLIDYVDSLDVTESKEYKAMEDALDDLNNDIENIEDEIAELEDELEEANG